MQLFKIALLTSLLLCAIMPTDAQNTQAPLNKQQWSYDTDPYGSEAIINEKLIRHGGIWIKFKRVPRINAMRNSWIHLIHKLPTAALVGHNKISLTYQCDIPLLIKFSQQEYGKDGDHSHAYYQLQLPATTHWTTKEVALKDFYRPKWTPASSKDYGLLPEHIDAIYLTPSMTDKDGGEAILQIRAIELLP